MTTAYPGAQDVFVNPTASDLQSSVTVPHADQHTNVNDAVMALEAKVGENGSALSSTHDYKLSAITGSEKAVSSLNFSGTSYGTNTGDQALFTSVLVSGQSTITATGTTSQLTIIGSGVTVTTNTGTGSLLFSVTTSTGGGGGGDIAITGVVTGSGTSSITLTHVASTGTGATVLQGTATLSGATLVGSPVISGATIVSTTLSGAILIGATLSGSTSVGGTFSGATIVASTISGATIVGSTLQRRLVSLSNSSGQTINLANGNVFTLTGLTTAALFSFTGTSLAQSAYPYEIRILSTGAQAVTWDSIARGSSDQSLPSTTFGSTKWERWLFEWNEFDSKADILTVNRGH